MSAGDRADQAQVRLERRARALLRAYPAEYRRMRGEEIIGTLLEATPPGWSYPSARDAWALVTGGRSARAARNRGAGAPDNLRLGVLLGISVCLSGYFGYAVLSTLLVDWHLGGWNQMAGAVVVVAAAIWLNLMSLEGAQLCVAAALALLLPTGWLILRHPARPRPLRP